MERYNSTAQIPDMNPRRRLLLEAFDTGSIMDLLNTLYKLAEDDLYASLPGRHAQKRTAKASMEIMLHDRNSGRRDMLALLLSLPRPVIEAIILNTIGTKYATDAEFRKLFYRKDASAGIYLNTALKTSTQGFQGNDWRWIQWRIRSYVNHANVIINAHSPQGDRDAAAEAYAIDNAYRARQVQGMFRTSIGLRYWLGTPEARTKTEMFREKMKDRVRPDLDPSLSTHQLQSPVEVGLAHYDLANRMADHHPQSGLYRTVKPWGLFLSVLKGIGHQSPEVISLPILMIWDAELLMKGEILITLLGGALVEDGGFNPTQAGCSGRRQPAESYQNELNEVFQDNDWLAENLTTAEAEAQKRKSALQACSDFDTGILGQNVADLTKDIGELILSRTELDKTLLEETKKEEDEIARLREHHESLMQRSIRVNHTIAFQNLVDSWLDGGD
jgi:hypothetical protein